MMCCWCRQESYTVGSVSSGARFRTIQAAVDRAEARGASFDTPAQIRIFPGFYSENVVANGGGLLFLGTGNEWGPFVSGSFTLNSDPGANNLWSFEGMGITGAIDFVGASGSNYGIEFQNMQCFGQVTVQESGAQFRAVASRFSTGVADPVRFPNGANTVRLFGCIVNGSIGSRALSAPSLEARHTRFDGHVEVTGSNGGLYHCTVFSDNTCLEDQTTSVSEHYTNAFHLQTAGVPCINKTGSGTMNHGGNSANDNASSPFVAVSGGSAVAGEMMEP